MTGLLDTLLEQVVTNLLTNALKYGDGKPIELVMTAHGAGARLEVSDHGLGVAAEHHERIFERFERAATDRRYAGFGLGLWITSRIVEEFNGVLSVRSAAGEAPPSSSTCHALRDPDTRRAARWFESRSPP